MQGTTADHFDLQHYLRLAWRWKWLLLLVVVVLPAGVYTASKLTTKTYEAKTTLFVQATTVSASGSADQSEVSTSSPESVARLVKTPLVADIAAKALGEPDAGRELLKRVSAQLDPSAGNADANFLTIAARDHDPQHAADIAGAFSNAIATKRTREALNAIDKTIKSLSDAAPTIRALGASAKSDLADQLQELRTLRASQQNATEVVDPVQTPKNPISPKPRRNAVLALILSLLLAAALVPILDRFDRKIREAAELERIAGAPLLAMLPDAAFPGRRPEPAVKEAFQTLRASLTSFNVDDAITSVLITSPTRADGKSTVSAGLAVALAQDGRRVIVIDGDLRRGQLASRLGVESATGLGAVLLGDVPVREALLTVRGVNGNLLMLPAGPPVPNPSVLLGSGRMEALLAKMGEHADLVLIDTPPLMVVSDAIPLLEAVSGVILVARVGATMRDALGKTARVVAQARGNTLGVVATGTRLPGLYGYGAYVSSAEESSDAFPLPQNGAGAGDRFAGSRLLQRLPGRAEKS